MERECKLLWIKKEVLPGQVNIIKRFKNQFGRWSNTKKESIPEKWLSFTHRDETEQLDIDSIVENRKTQIGENTARHFIQFRELDGTIRTRRLFIVIRVSEYFIHRSMICLLHLDRN